MFPKEYRIQTHFWYYNIVESSFHYLEIDLKFHRADGRNSNAADPGSGKAVHQAG